MNMRGKPPYRLVTPVHGVESAAGARAGGAVPQQTQEGQ